MLPTKWILKKITSVKYANDFITTEEINSVKLNKKLWVEGKVDTSLLKYFPVKPKEKKQELNFLNINIVLFDKFDK